MAGDGAPRRPSRTTPGHWQAQAGRRPDSDSESDSPAEATLGPCIQVRGALGTVRDLTRGSLSTMCL